MLVSFENGVAEDVSGRYSVSSQGYRLVSEAAMGKSAAMFQGVGNGFKALGKKGTIFGTEGWSGSFVIEFWLCPAIVENGETLISWRSNRNVEDYPLYQMLRAVFAGNHLEWNLTNLFVGYTDNGGEVNLSGIKTLIPGQWSHHALIYSEDNSLLEYRVNGILEDLKYMTVTGYEDSQQYPLCMGVASVMEICPDYTGKLDDFRVLRSDGSEENINTYTGINVGEKFTRYNVDGGRFETQPILVEEGSSLVRLNAEIYEPEQTEVQLYVRSGNNFYEWNDSFPSWKPISPGSEISDVSGKYFQVAAQLYPDGSGTVSPSITSISLVYSQQEPPLPPFSITARGSDGVVELNWSRSLDEVDCYYVYYGERPGEYLGRVAIEGNSPVAVGEATSFKFTGLKNGKIYYFAVAAEYNGRIGRLSSEVFARPSMQVQ